MSRWLLTLGGLLALSVMAGSTASTPVQDKKAPPKSDPKATLMQRKLQQSQKLLEGLALSDFDKIAAATAELAQIRKEAAWMVLKTPDYETFSMEFSRQIDAAAKAAKAKNIDAAVLAYMDMTLTCVKCHKHVREAGIALNINPLRESRGE
jgi:hypothetical protein